MAHEMAHIEQFRKKEKEEFFRVVRMLEYGNHSLEEEVEDRVKEISTSPSIFILTFFIILRLL